MRRTSVAAPAASTAAGTVDSSAIYLHGVAVRGGTHDTFFVTTTYGITLAIDAPSGRILWQWKPPGYSHWAGRAQITTATPVADPSRRWIYAASPDGRIEKLTVASGHAVWRRSITRDPSREKIASSLNFAGGHVIATTGGYIGDAPSYQGHVAVLAARTAGSCRSGTRSARTVTGSSCPPAAPRVTPRSGDAPGRSSSHAAAISSSRRATRGGTAERTGATQCPSCRRRRSSSATTRRRTRMS